MNDMATKDGLDKIIQELVTANHILYDKNIVDGFGHISVRHPFNASRYLLARNMAPALVTKEDIVTYDLDSKPQSHDDSSHYLERFIHGAIYSVRPDVKAVVHFHAASVIPWSYHPEQFRVVSHMASFLHKRKSDNATAYIPADDEGILVASNKMGIDLAKVFTGGGTFALMRGHGATVVAENLQLAVYRAVYAELNARILKDMTVIGGSNSEGGLDDRLAEACQPMIEGQVQRPWALWEREAKARGYGKNYGDSKQ